MAFPENFISELIERNDIVSVVSDYVRLTKRSGSNMFGLCPFHSEKTPSFSVSPDKQFYHCFGCGKGGGVINFIMDIENLSYPEAVEFLAKRANMPMPEETNDAARCAALARHQRHKDDARRFLCDPRVDMAAARLCPGAHFGADGFPRCVEQRLCRDKEHRAQLSGACARV